MTKLAQCGLTLGLWLIAVAWPPPAAAAGKKGRRRDALARGQVKRERPAEPALSAEQSLRHPGASYGSLGLSTSFGAALGVYLSRDIALEMRGNYYLHGSASVFSLALKYYYGNSFFADMAVAHGTIEPIDSFCILVCQSELDQYFAKHPRVLAIDGEYASLGAEVVLGNRWHWDNGFSFGVDWWSFYVPMWTYEEPVLVFADNATEAESASALAELERHRIVAVATPLRIQVGWQF